MDDTTNKFLVSISGGNFDKIAILNPPFRAISREDALNLAAWLIATALLPNDDREFLEYLGKIRNT